MAKKISKHSRAARRNEIVEPEAKSLSKLPRAESTDTTSAIIRATTKKNEDLLNNKMAKKENRDRVTKKKNAQITNMNKEKVERAMELGDRLEGKISKSKQRARYVQTARKLGWDAINSLVKGTEEKKEPVPEQVEQMEEDAMVDDFYNEEPEKPMIKKAANAFSLLEEMEC